VKTLLLLAFLFGTITSFGASVAELEAQKASLQTQAAGLKTNIAYMEDIRMKADAAQTLLTLGGTPSADQATALAEWNIKKLYQHPRDLQKQLRGVEKQLTKIETKIATARQAAAPPASQAPPGNKGSNLKGLEASLQRQVDQLSKAREAAVTAYTADPTPENHAKAAEIKSRLQGLVDQLNAARRRVDEAEGTSRPEIAIRSAREIAAENSRNSVRGNRPDPGDSTREATHSSRPECPPLEHHHGGKPGC
jgi:chromosome segregation ATPase